MAEESLRAIKEQLDTYKDAVDDRNRLLGVAYAEIKQIKERLREFNDAVDDRNRRLGVVHTELDEKDATIAALQKEISEASDRIRELGDPAAAPEAGAEGEQGAAEDEPAGPAPAPERQEPAGGGATTD